LLFFQFLGINDAENVAETGVSEGWFEVKPGKIEEYVIEYKFTNF
jgi:hypothetical protein